MKKIVLLLVVSAGLILFSLLTVEADLASKFSISLPIAIHRGFPIPVFFWMGIFLYVSVASFIAKKPLKNGFKKGLMLGFFLHLLLLLLKLKFQIAENPALLNSVFYRVYCELFIFGSVSVLALFCTIKINYYRLLTDKKLLNQERDFLLLPFAVLFTYAISFLMLHGFVIHAFGALAIFALGFYAFSQKEKIKHLWNILRNIKQFILQEKVLLLLVFIAALSIRIFFLLRVMSNPDYLNTGSDATLYDGLAQSFLSGEKVTEPFVAGYWMFLALVYKIFGRDYFMVGLVQSILASFSCIFVYYSAKYIFNITVARIAALFSVVSFTLIFPAAAIGHQVMDVFYVTLGMMLISKYAYSQAKLFKKPLFLILTGLTLGLSIATREVGFFWPIIAVFLLIFFLSRRIGFKTVFIDSFIILLFTSIALAPFIYRNIKNLGVWYPISSTSGANYPLIDAYLKAENPELVNAGVDLSNGNKLFKAFRDKPIFVAKVWFGNSLRKFKELYFSQGYGGFDMIFLYRQSDYYYALWFYFYLITIAGIIIAFKKYRLTIHSLLFFFIAYRTCIHLLTESSYRHRAPIEPFLILYFAFGLYNLVLFTKSGTVHEDSIKTKILG